MRVILNEYIHGLGCEGEVVVVKSGYGRNFLLPKGKALRETPENLQKFEEKRAELKARLHKLKSSAIELMEFLQKEPFIIESQASQEGHLYGTVRPLTIYNALVSKFSFLKRESVVLPHTIKEIGAYSFQLRIHPEVICSATVYVFPSQDEAHSYIKEAEEEAKREAAENAKKEALRQKELERELEREKEAAQAAIEMEASETDPEANTEEGISQNDPE
ncbi:MAG: 50S ribosomal protein L9 [Alphaproteobacteria bacterium]|nr:50S ribosomal protein L9 [Alphaproteobacteria bacterium]